VSLTPKDKALAAFQDAPTTEIFTGFGAEPGFADSVQTFAVKVNAEWPAGYYGSASGPVDGDVKGPTEAGDGAAVKLVLGWESLEAHAAVKANGGEFLSLHDPDFHSAASI
jgi:hypothetical protein